MSGYRAPNRTRVSVWLSKEDHARPIKQARRLNTSPWKIVYSGVLDILDLLEE